MKYKVGDLIYYKGWVKCPDIPDDVPPEKPLEAGIYTLSEILHGKLPYNIRVDIGFGEWDDWGFWEGEIEPVKTDFKVEDFL